MMLLISLYAHAAAPATVLEHTLDVRLDWGQRLQSTQRWTVRIDDPAACVAGLITPPGLAGAVDGDAIVIDNLLIVPADATAGDTFTLVATQQGGRGRHSGVFRTAPDLPVERAEVKVTALGRQPLTVWADPRADPIWSTRGAREAVVSWEQLPADAAGHLVWSSWEDWIEAGRALDATVDALMAEKSALGRDLAGDLGSSNLPELVRRTLSHFRVEPGNLGSFDEARPAATLAREPTGSAAERAVLLIAMLRAAGYEAGPAMRTTSDMRGGTPIIVPSPKMLTAPMVRAEDRAGRTVWIDPASDAVDVPATPSAMIGATVWVPGELPERSIPPGVVDGEVSITTSARLNERGEVTWSADVSASGTALEAIRTLLQPLDADGQQQALLRLAQRARPSLERFAAKTSGVSDTSKTLSLSVSGQDDGTFEAWAGGLRGTFPPVLASAIAAWLPPNIRVRELIDFTPPSGFTVPAFTHPASAYAPDGQLDRRARRNGPRVRIDVDAIRPYSVTSSARDGRAAAFFAAQATDGVQLMVFRPASNPIVKPIRALELPAAERAALEALLWWSTGDDRRATKTLKRALKSESATAVAAPLRQWVDPADDVPWRTLAGLVPDDALPQRLEVIQTFERTHPALALELVQPLTTHLNDAIAGPALMVAMRVGDAPAHRNGLVNRLPQLEAPALAHRARVLIAEHDQSRGATVADLAAIQPTDARARMIHLYERARDTPQLALIQQVEALRAEQPDDPTLAARAAATLHRGRADAAALEHALDAARLAHTDPRLWADVAAYAVRDGQLRLALDALARAHSLAPDDTEIATRALHAGLLARDRALVEAMVAAGAPDPAVSWPLSLDDAMGIARSDELLALLQFHDAEVEASPIHLGLRAQLRNDAGLRDAAARDGINLTLLHQQPRGRAVAFAATAGRVFGTSAMQLLDDVGDESVRLTRMDYRLVTGSGDPRVDARALRDQLRAQQVLQAIGDPAAAAAAVDGWPAELEPGPSATPRGYSKNAVLSAARGVDAYSHADRQLAIVVVHAATDLLPPPLATLFSIDARPLATTAEGHELIALRDGYVPLYALRARGDGRTTYGMGFTPEAAGRALRDALATAD